MEINFKVDPIDRDLIAKVVERAFTEMGPALKRARITPLSLTMDITATHANGCRLRLDEMVEGPAFDFAHDVGGIVRHINRETGQLGDCFVPRFAERNGR